MGKREQLLEIMEEAAKGETKTTLRARIVALEAQLAERVKVKPLEWNECKFGGVLSFDAKVGFGDLEYSLQSYDDGTWGWFTSFRTERGYSGSMGKGLTLEVAKAAAQADFERRILSALEASPPAPKVTEEDWREIEQAVQPRIRDGYTAVKISKPGFWFVKGPGPATPFTAAQEAGKP